MKFEALRPDPPAPDRVELSEEERAEKLSLIGELESKLKEVEMIKEAFTGAVTEAEKSEDWSAVELTKIRLRSSLAKAKVFQRKLEGRGSVETIEAYYHYKNEKGKDASETIEISFESSLGAMVDLYQKYGVEVSPDFSEQMHEIWERNADSMTEAIAEKGFNKALFIPENLPGIAELEKKMTKDYKKEKGNETQWWVKAGDISEERVGTRIVLVHSAPDLTAHTELKKTLGKKYGGEKEDGKDNRAEDFIKAGESLTLSEYLILQREVFDTTGVHLDSKKTPDDQYILWTWLPGSKDGTRVVNACWNPADGQLFVGADDPSNSTPDLGCRLSRCFQ